jgi:hypothetical protein
MEEITGEAISGKPGGLRDPKITGVETILSK